jgi:predicted acylesterase/phospholipase RssA
VIPVIYKNHVGNPCILRNYTTSNEPAVDLTIAEAMLATCSTPPIFTPTIISKDFANFEYIAADIGLSNPIREIIAEAHRAFGDEVTVSCLLSVGCGHPGVSSAPNNSDGTSWTDFLEGVAKDSEKTAQNIATQMSQLTLYHRLSVKYGLENGHVHEWKDPDTITTHTTNYLNDLDIVVLLDRCVDTIKHGDGFTTLERLSTSGIRPP